MNKIERVKEILLKLEPIVDYLGNIDITLATRLLKERVENPKSYVTLVGETSTGKSTIVNGLLRNEVLPTSARPTTGTVTEVELNKNNAISYLAIKKDGSRQTLSAGSFRELSKNPDESVLRLYVSYPVSDESITGLSIFDTPGYNSVNVEHEEALKEFIPNSDAIIFVSGYRQGFGQYDQILLEITAESLKHDPEIPFLLVINRVPPDIKKDDKRVKEIIRNVEDTLHKKVNAYLVKSVPHEDKDGKPIKVLPDCGQLWHDIKDIVTGESRTKILIEKITQALDILLDETLLMLSQIENACNLENESIERIKEFLDKYAKDEKKSLELIEDVFKRLRRSLPEFIEYRLKTAKDKIIESLDNYSSWTKKDECMAYVQAHLMPYEINRAGKDIENYIYEEIDRLNKELEDLANTAIRELDKSIDMSDFAIREIMDKIIKRMSNRLLDHSAKSLAATLKGGVGGYAAGVGNIVKMAVSRIGKIFGKTFSRNVYTKIGKFFNKTRTTILIQVVIEGILYLYDVATFKKKLKNNIEKAIAQWQSEVKEHIIDSLESIKDETVKGVKEIYSEFVENTKKELDDAHSNKKYDIKKIEVMKNSVLNFKKMIGGYNE